MTKNLTPATDDGVQVDGLIRQLSIEAETGIRKALNDMEHHKKEMDRAQQEIVYWQGWADSLRVLMQGAERTAKTQTANEPAPAPASPASAPIAPAPGPTSIGRGRRSPRRSPASTGEEAE